VITFRVDGIPKGQPRPRACRRGAHAGVYDPGTADGWKACVMLAARKHRPVVPISAPVRVYLMFCMPRPKRMKATDRTWHVSRPDLDNLQKSTIDAMTDMGMWVDDSQVCFVSAIKMYANSDERPGAEIEITQL
jgi:crossover junction endodeoxyribonuclease RusA